MTNKLLVISGASRGIGKVTAELFLENGYRVINLSRTDPAIDGIEHISTDVSDHKALDQTAQELRPELEQAEQVCLIHNAGILNMDSALDMTAEQLREVLQVNVVAPSQLNAALIPVMKPGSSIFFIGSTVSEKGVANTCSYVTSKHAVVGLMRATCQDIVGTNIHTACICPGFVRTEMLDNYVGGNQDILREIAESLSFKRLVEPKEVAVTLMFAARNPVINGAVLHANLGPIAN